MDKREKIQEEIRQKRREETQLLRQLGRENNRKDYFNEKERKARARRLIQRGGAIESVLPEVRGLSEKAFYMALEDYFDAEANKKAFLSCVAKARNKESA